MSTYPPVRKEIVVEASQERAFRTFTDGIDRWWPRDHHIGASPLKRLLIESHVDGRWYSECEDGSEVDVGKVLAWEPPHRVVLSWQITGQWQFDPSFITEVEISFTSEGPKRTRVVLEHRNLERFGDSAAAIRKTFDSPEGWTRTLTLFAREATTE